MMLLNDLPPRPRTPLSETAAPNDAFAEGLNAALVVIGDRWSLAIVASLATGARRFNDLIADVAPIARTVLSDRLRRLEEAGVVIRRQYSTTPPRSNYRLTIAGAELAKVAASLADWGSRRLGDGSPALVHSACGDAVMPSYSCASCGPVSAREVTSAQRHVGTPASAS